MKKEKNGKLILLNTLREIRTLIWYLRLTVCQHRQQVQFHRRQAAESADSISESAGSNKN